MDSVKKKRKYLELLKINIIKLIKPKHDHMRSIGGKVQQMPVKIKKRW